MIFISIFITLAILVLVIAIITRPLYTMKTENANDFEQNKAALNTEYQQTLNRIRELEQEHLEGKLSDGDYQDRRGILNKEAVDILKQLESNQTYRP
jgi:hypothetical protein